MPNKYVTSHDLNQRLNKTLCRYDGKPVYVLYNGDTQLCLYDVVHGTKKLLHEIEPEDPKFDISIMELGYFNYEGKYGKGARYAIKHPTKQWKAALSGCSWVDIQGNKVQYNDGFHNQGFYDALVGVFPAPQEALQTILSEEKDEVAISQEVAFGRTPVGVVFIYFRTKPVGWIAPGESKVNVVDHGYSWVVERLLNRSGLTLGS
jgi:hypothetical protein